MTGTPHRSGGPVRLLVLILVTAVFAGTAALAALGFVVARSFADTDGFVTRMSEQLQQPDVHAEVQTLAADRVRQAVVTVGGSLGPLGDLAAGAGADALADQASDAVDTDAFRRAWVAWSALLHQGLSDYAQEVPNPDVAVTPGTMTVGIEPLMTPVVGETVAVGIAGVLDFLRNDDTVTLVTDPQLAVALESGGRLAELRWILLGIAAGSLFVLILVGRALWAALGLGAAALALAGLAVAASLGPGTASNGQQLPATSAAVAEAFTAGWSTTFLLAAGGCALAGVAVVVVARLSRS